MRRISVFFLLALLSFVQPKSIGANTGTFGCELRNGVCQAFIDCNAGFTTDPQTMPNCSELSTPERCVLAKVFCVPVIDTGQRVRENCPENNISTAIGCIPFNDTNAIAAFFLRWALGIAGGVALAMIGFSAYRIMTSQGDPRRLQGGQELLLSALGGLIMVILSVYLLRFIGVDLLEIF